MNQPPQPNTHSETANYTFPAVYAATSRFSTGKPRTFWVSPSEHFVLFCNMRSVDDSTLALWKFDAKTREESILVDPVKLLERQADQSAGTSVSESEKRRRERSREAGTGIVGYDVFAAPPTQSSTGAHEADTARSLACFVLNGTLFVVNVATGESTAANTEKPVFDPRFSPDGSKIAYVHNGNLRVLNLNSPAGDQMLCSASSVDVTYGVADFIAAEEMGRSRGYWWSPTSEQIAATKVNEQNVEQWWISQPAEPAKPAHPIRYPAAGTTNSTTELLLIDVPSADSTNSPANPASIPVSPMEYLADVQWSNAGLFLTLQSRDQKTVTVNRVDTNTNELSTEHTISADPWVDLVSGSPQICEVGLVTIENQQRDDVSYRAVCLDGLAITDSSLQVQSLNAIGVFGFFDGIQAIVSAWATPVDTALYSVELATGATRCITPTPGVHTAYIAADTVVTSSSCSDSPGSRTLIHEVADGELRPTAELFTRSTPAGFDLRPTFLTIDGPAGNKIETVVFFPPGHDGSSLPVLMDPYGGPHARRVRNYYDGHLVSQWFANQGYAVIVADGRGTPGHGPANEHAIWGDVAQPVLEDQIRALDDVAERFGSLDLSRVGVRGWSFGGYLAALAVLARPDRFHCALAGAPVTTWNLYDTHYTERYLGTPSDYPDHYRRTDLLRLAKERDSDLPIRDLLLIHGLADDNVVAAHTLQLSSALLAVGYDHQVLPLSSVTHMTPQASVAENLLRFQLRFLNDSLRPHVPDPAGRQANGTA